MNTDAWIGIGFMTTLFITGGAAHLFDLRDDLRRARADAVRYMKQRDEFRDLYLAVNDLRLTENSAATARYVKLGARLDVARALIAHRHGGREGKLAAGAPLPRDPEAVITYRLRGSDDARTVDAWLTYPKVDPLDAEVL